MNWSWADSLQLQAASMFLISPDGTPSSGYLLAKDFQTQ